VSGEINAMLLTQIVTIICLCAAFARIVATLAVANSIRDPETGLSLTLPPGYSITESHSKPGTNILGNDLKSNELTRGSCDINYMNSRGSLYRRYQASAQSWEDRFEKYSIEETRLWSFATEPRAVFDENYPLKPPSNRSFTLSLSADFKTADGYLKISCRAHSREFDKTRPVLESLILGISLPN
jgi:hypothetical protein